LTVYIHRLVNAAIYYGHDWESRTHKENNGGIKTNIRCDGIIVRKLRENIIHVAGYTKQGLGKKYVKIVDCIFRSV
jgi:hypothetical protein